LVHAIVGAERPAAFAHFNRAPAAEAAAAGTAGEGAARRPTSGHGAAGAHALWL
jgi:hypothetical protein